MTIEPARNRASIRRLAAPAPTLALFGHGPPLRDPVAWRAFATSLPAYWHLSEIGENQSDMAERRLLLLRHAKSSWDDPALPDHDRPLARRGRKAAKLIGEHVRHQRVPVALVLCSSARRARETVELVDPPGEILVEREIYAASADQLLERLRGLSSDIEVAMLVGHNPAIQELAIALARDTNDLAGRFPTGALATLSFAGPWQTLSPEQTELVAFVKPRQLG